MLAARCICAALAAAGLIFASPAGALAAEPTTTQVSCVPSPVTVGLATSCTATVAPVAAPGLPTGTVTWQATGGGTLSAGSCALAALTGSARCKVAYTPAQAGAHAITATYSGDASFDGSPGSATVQANPAAKTAKKKCKKAKKKKGTASARKRKCGKKGKR